MITCTVNNTIRKLDVPGEMRLIDILRDVLELRGTKEGCSVGECGACTIIMNGQAVHACMIPACQIEGADIQTIESIDTNEVLSRLQQAFLEHGAVQCGYCIPGMLMSAKALLDSIQHPTVDQIKEALAGNLCRCTGYVQIIDAIQDAAENPAEKQA